MNENPALLHGILHFHSETGTEGGYWAFQDEQFIGLEDHTEKCAKCNYYRTYIEDCAKEDQEPSPSFFGAPCSSGEHEWVKAYPDGVWSYEGLHVLRDGDQLTIWSRGRTLVMWQGTIQLHQHPLFTEDSDGLWIHADQAGIDRGTWSAWFFGEFPADLTPADPAYGPSAEGGEA